MTYIEAEDIVGHVDRIELVGEYNFIGHDHLFNETGVGPDGDIFGAVKWSTGIYHFRSCHKIFLVEDNVRTQLF